MDPKHILETIANKGECEELDEKSCKMCPLARLKKRPDETGWLGCIDAVCGADTTDMNDKYKKIAEEILADILILEEITGDKQKT